ncbi:translocase of chloroplast 159, chloroplastic [Cajanus cajan]|uniref:translocase of chloroplast 159, chloroplastic n=1 Tax=Cajanus cajan TaxID=3821 RepID=UPI00098DB7B0|nr:translocase of chloroplast 159, chloroplastic [Cajanus cajan]
MDSQTSLYQIDPNSDTDSENDGFVSGEEGFEAQPTRPILVHSPVAVAVAVADSFLDSPSQDALRPIAKVTYDDDASADDSDDVVSDKAPDKGDFSDTNEVFVEASGGADDADGDGDGDGDGGGVVDTLQVNLLGSGVAVVGDEVGVVESEIKGLEEAVPSGVSLDNGFDAIQKVDEGVLDGQLGAEDALVGAGESGENGNGLKSDIVVPLEVGGASEVVDQDGVKMEVGGVEREIGSSVEVEEVAPNGEREIDGSVFDGKIGSGEEEGDKEVEVGQNGEREIGSRVEEEEDEEVEDVGGYGDREVNGSLSDDKGDGVVFGSTDAANKFLEDLELQQPGGAGGSSRDDERIDGQIVTDSEEEEETDDEGDGKELFDTATLAALLKAASGADQDGGSITITSQDGSRLFSVERPAGLGSSLQSGKAAMRPTRPSLFAPSVNRASAITDSNLSEEEKKKLEKLQEIRIKYLRLVHRLGFTTEESIAAQVLYRLSLVAGRQSGQMFSLEAAKETASQLEAEGRDDFDFSVNILVLGKAGVGKSATINSIFGETKTSINACGPATTAVKEIVGVVDGVKIRIFDTPGLKSSAFEQSFNAKVLSVVKKLTKKTPPDIVLYVDRLDLQTRDMNDLPMLRSITSALGSSIWRNVIVTLTHAASAPPDGPSGAPLSYDVFVAQRSHIVQQAIGQAVGDIRLMNPSLMNPVSLVENHPSCRKNRDGQKVLPNGQSWRPLLLLLCYSMKMLSDAGNISKTQESFDHRRLFGFRPRSPPLPYLLSWLLQSRTYPKLPADQGGADNGDSDIEMADLSDSDLDDDEDEYDQLPPFKPMKKAQVAKLTREQQKAYLEEYDYRVKLLQKKQWREELRRMRELKKKGNNNKVIDYGYMEEDDQENGSPAAVPVPLPDMALPPSFDSDNPAYRYRFLEPTSQLLTRPVLDNHGWDHDCGYDGVNIEHSLGIINKFPAAVTVQVTKDKKDFSIHLDSSVAAKLGENGSSMAGFDIQNIGKQLAYIVRGETKFKNLKRNKTAAGVTVTFLGENVSTGLKVEDQIAVGKRLVLVGSTGMVKSQTDSAYGANVEIRLREADFPVGQDQSSLSLSLVKWRGDLALGANLQSQISLGRSYKMAVRAGLNNKLSGQISVRTSSSDQLQIALVAILPIAKAIYKNFWPGASENYSIY